MTPEMQSHLSGISSMKKRHIILGNFLGGIFWGAGSVIGATIVIALLIGTLRTFNWLPYAKETADTIENQTSRPLTK